MVWDVSATTKSHTSFFHLVNTTGNKMRMPSTARAFGQCTVFRRKDEASSCSMCILSYVIMFHFNVYHFDLVIYILDRTVTIKLQIYKTTCSKYVYILLFSNLLNILYNVIIMISPLSVRLYI